jgi:hypothetical protein
MEAQMSDNQSDRNHSTLVQLLREAGDPGFDPWTEEQMLLQDAANRIEELEAQLAAKQPSQVSVIGGPSLLTP